MRDVQKITYFLYSAISNTLCSSLPGNGMVRQFNGFCLDKIPTPYLPPGNRWLHRIQKINLFYPPVSSIHLPRHFFWLHYPVPAMQLYQHLHFYNACRALIICFIIHAFCIPDVVTHQPQPTMLSTGIHTVNEENYQYTYGL